MIGHALAAVLAVPWLAVTEPLTVAVTEPASIATFKFPLPSRAAGSCVLLTGCVVWYAPLTGTVPEMATVPETG
jgi:hypothetical protein